MDANLSISSLYYCWMRNCALRLFVFFARDARSRLVFMERRQAKASVFRAAADGWTLEFFS
jgi:hypothetical protein